MADSSMWDKFKSAFEEPPKGPYKPAPGLDPSKAQAMAKVFGGGDDEGGAINRRLDQLKKSKDY